MLKLRVLGSSSKGNSYLLENNDTKILLDCGVDYKKIIDNVPCKELSGIVITHEHHDHCKAIKKLKDYVNCSVYSHKEVLDILPIIDTIKVEIKALEKFDIGSFTLLPFEVKHDVTNYGFLIKDNISNHKLVYITDCGDIPNIQLKDIDTFLIESNYNQDWLDEKLELEVKDIRNLRGIGHLSVQKAIQFLKDNVNYNTKFIFLGHITPNINDYCEMEYLVENEIVRDNPCMIRALDPNMEEPIEFVLKEDVELW